MDTPKEMAIAPGEHSPISYLGGYIEERDALPNRHKLVFLVKII